MSLLDKFPSLGRRTGGDVPTGVMLPFGGPVAPSGYLLCDGAAVSRTEFANLFATLGTGWGEGDGSTTFNVPDYRGRVPRGVDAGAGVDPDAGARTVSNAGGNTGDEVGTIQGDDFKSHAHQKILAAQSPGAGNGTPQSSQGGETLRPTSNDVTGGNETRMKNAGCLFIVKT